MTSAVMDRLHRWLGRSALATRAALLLRNQCRAVVKYHLMTTHDVRGSGEQWLVEQLAPRLRTVVDAGANRGAWTRMLLERAPHVARIVLFEPAPRAADALRAELASTRGITIVEAALSDRVADAAAFFEDPGEGETSSLTRGASTTAAVERQVRVTTLDEALAQLGIDAVDLLKIDTEGNDLAVLRGASALLRQRRAAVIQWEYGDSWAAAGATLGAALALLDANGYDSFLLKRDGLYRFDYTTFGEFFTFANFVSVSRDAPLAAAVRKLL